MAEYSRLAKGSFISSGSAQVINLPFQPDYVRFTNYTVANTAATSQNIASAFWDVAMGQGFAVIQGYNTTPTLIYDTVTVNGISTFSAGQLLQFGAAKQIIASTGGATTCSFNVTSHGYSVGDVVMFEGLYQSATTGMTQMTGIPFSVTTVTDANNFVVTWASNGSNYTNLSGSPSNAKVFKVLYPNLYLPQDVVINTVTTGSTTTISTTTPHNFEIGQEIAFRVAPPWKTTQLNSLPNANIPGQPIYGYVVSLTDNFTFVCSINSTGFTAFTTNVPYNQLIGLAPAQVVPVGDVNTGGKAISSGSVLYPPPAFPLPNNSVGTINGPAIKGAFVNNTSQGFIIGAGAGTVLTTGKLVGASSNVVYWEAVLHDLVSP